MSKKPKLTVKEAKLVKGIAEGKPKRVAAQEAGYGSTPESAAAIASKTLKKVNVQEALQAELARKGITLDIALEPVKKALTAKKIVQIEGDFFETEVDDIALQLQGHDRVMKLIGANKGSEGGDVHYHLHQAEQREKYDL